MDILAIILACSLHADDQLVRTLVDVQSSGNPYFVGDLRTLKTYDSLRSPEDALRVADDIRRQGGRPAVGLLGVPLEWAKRYDRPARTLFDACTNVAVGTAALADYDARCSGRRRTHLDHRDHRPPAYARRRYCVVREFARDLGVRVAAPIILRSLLELAAKSPDPIADPPPERSGPFATIPHEGNDDDARLFLRSSAGRASSGVQDE
jgi:hypothetical protein